MAFVTKAKEVDMAESIFATTDIFPTWLSAFQHNPRIAEKMAQIREIRQRRAQGNQQLPYILLNGDFWHFFNLYCGVRSAEIGRQDLPMEKAYFAHKACIDKFTPIAHRTFWARWLYLERALEIASKSGDLLFGAIVLRTMAEDVWALLELARFEVMLKESQDSPTAEHFQEIKGHGDLLWSRFLPPIADLPELPGSKPVSPFDRPEYKELKEAFQKLNDYVHPNYGSHLLALFPERTIALEILLDAYIIIYEAFFKVPWVEAEIAGPLSPLPPIVIRSWHEEIEFLMKNIIPQIHRHRVERRLVSENEDPAPHLKRWLESSCSQDLQLSWQVTPDWFEPVRALAEFVCEQSDTDPELCELLIRRTDVGLSPRPVDLFVFAGARRLAGELEQLFRNGRPSPEELPLDWFRCLEKAIELVLCTTQHKIALLNLALIRQLNDRNPVGSILAMRSLIEHYGIAIYLGERLNRIWAKISKHGSSGRLPIKQFVELEENLARFLAGTKGTVEEASAWKKEWAALGLDRAINLRSATEEGLREDVLGYLYGFGSDVIHGRKARGVELCPPTDTTYLMANLSRSLIVLDLLNGLDRQMNVIAKAGRVLQKMESLRKALAKPGVDWQKTIRTVLTPKEQLKHGRDYTGSGTIDDPFVFVGILRCIRSAL